MRSGPARAEGTPPGLLGSGVSRADGAGSGVSRADDAGSTVPGGGPKISERSRVGLGPKMDRSVQLFQDAIRKCIRADDGDLDITLTVMGSGELDLLVRGGPGAARVQRCLRPSALSPRFKTEAALGVLSSTVRW